VVRVEIEHFETWDDAAAAESLAIETEHPIHNKHHRRSDLRSIRHAKPPERVSGDQDENQNEWWVRYLAKYPTGGPDNPEGTVPDPGEKLSATKTEVRERKQLREARWS
jgi:hypothetical protein